MELEKTARRHVAKVEQTIDYLRTRKLTDDSLPERKKEYIRRDVEALEFVIEYAKEALSQRGIRV